MGKSVLPVYLPFLLILASEGQAAGISDANINTFGGKGNEVLCIDLWKDQQMTIKSPGIGEKGYRNKIRITYRIMAPPQAKISFRCPQFRLQLKDPWSGKCVDYMELPPAAGNEDQKRSSSSLPRKQFCGLDVPNHLFIFDPAVPGRDTIVFSSDNRGMGNTFLCVLRKEMAEEGSTFYVNLMTSPTAEIFSPQVKKGSRIQIQSSVFSIVAPSRTRAILSCSDFSVPENWKCIQEYLMINGVRYCGSRIPKNIPLYITPDAADLVRYADNVDTPGSFKCSVRRLKGEEALCSAPSEETYVNDSKMESLRPEVPDQEECIDLIATRKSIIQSEHFGFGNYSNNISTNQLILAPLASTITMSCHNFSLELSHWCKKDHLAIHSELWPLVRYCGDTYKGRQSLEDRNIISFVSDGHITSGGYRCTLQNHLVQVDHLVNLMSTNATWIAYSAPAEVGRWFNSRKQEVYVIVAPEDSMLNITCPVFNVGCRFSEDMHVGTKLYGDSLCHSETKSIQVPYNLANNTVVFTDDLRTSSSFFCAVTRIGGLEDSCTFPGEPDQNEENRLLDEQPSE